MSTTVQDVAEQALQLSPEDREALVERLIAGLDPALRLHPAWWDEITRRIAVMDAGHTRFVLADEALAAAKPAADGSIEHHAWPAAAALQVEMSQALARIVAEAVIGTPGPGVARILSVHRVPVSPVDRVPGDDVGVMAAAARRRRPGHWRCGC